MAEIRAIFTEPLTFIDIMWIDTFLRKEIDIYYRAFKPDSTDCIVGRPIWKGTEDNDPLLKEMMQKSMYPKFEWCYRDYSAGMECVYFVKKPKLSSSSLDTINLRKKAYKTTKLS